MDNILLLGLMGSGKSLLGRMLAERLHYSFYELDQKVLEATGYSSVDEVYRHKKSLWHEKEMSVMNDLSHRVHQVIACGGGIIENRLSFEYFQENSSSYHIFYLHVSPEILLKRFFEAHPDISHEVYETVQKNIMDLYAERDPLYRRIAHTTIENGKIDPETVGEKMWREMGGK